MVLLQLAISNFKVRRVRTALTLAAIALSVSLVVAVTSGYKSMENEALRFVNRYMGAADALVVPVNPVQGLVPEHLVGELTADPAVRQAVGRLESWRQLQRASGQIKPKNPEHVAAGAAPADKINVNLVGVRRPQDTDSAELSAGRWFDTSVEYAAVIDQVAAERLGVNIGQKLVLPGMTQSLSLTVIGLVHKPTFFAEQQPTVYMPIETLQHFTGEDNPPKVSHISIDLRGSANYDDFKQRWTARLARTDPEVRLHMRRDNAGELEKNLRGVHILSYLGGVISMLTAAFIIFSALSMGVSERQRTLAMLRAVGAVRGQVFQLVVLEGVALAAAGSFIGIPLGMLWMKLLSLRFPDFFAAGTFFSYGGMLFAAAGSLLTAILASLLPAWWASRVSPLQALNAFQSPPRSGPPLRWAVMGLVLISLDPLLFFGPVERLLKAMGFHDPQTLTPNIQLAGHIAVGMPGIMLGFFLLAPTIVWTVECLFSPLLGRCFFVPPKLLSHQLSTGLWRAAGTGAALMVGLATLIAMQVQGHTLIGGWQLPTKFPDMFIWSSDPISWADQKSLGDIPGIAPGSLMPVVVTTPKGDSKLSLAVSAVLSQDNLGVMFFAVNPDQALNMIQLDFRDDDGVSLPRDQQAAAAVYAAREMKKDRHIIVTDEFRQSRHIKLGQTIALQTSRNGTQMYTICGIVWSPGADVIISMFDLGRLLDQPTSGSVFGSIEDAKRDFGVTGARLFAADLQGGIDKTSLLKEAQKALGERGLSGGDVRQIKYGIERAFYRILALLSSVAIAALAVASLGVANTIMASVRSRRWQFGVLRSIGLQRGDLRRLVLAEAVMLGLVGVAMGLGAGLEIAVDARQLSGAVLGYSPAMLIPWGIVGGGCGAVVLVAVAASLWPALSIARCQPLELLQAGRAAI